MDIELLKQNIMLANEQIKNGIEEENVKREFDIVDFCNLFKVEVKEVLKVAIKILSYKDFINFKNAINKYKSFETTRDYDITIILNSTTEINCKKDKNGNIIPGTGEIVPTEFKQKIFDYLKANDIASNIKTYKALFRRYSNGTFSFDNKKFTLENKDKC